MKLKKDQLVLYTLGLLKKTEKPDSHFTGELISSALCITENTLDHHMTILSKSGLITRIKKKYVRSFTDRYEITEEGNKKIGKILEEVDRLLLTEDRHNIPSCLPVSDIISRIPDPMEKVFFLTLYNQNRYFDLPSFLDILRLSKEETGLINIFCDLNDTECGPRRESFIESFFQSSLYGNVDKDMLKSDIWKREDTDALIALEESKLRMGKFEETKLIHDHLLSSDVELTQNQWFVVMILWAHWLRRKGRIDESIEHLEMIMEMVYNRVYISFARITLAYSLFMKGDREKYKELFNSAIKSFRKHSLPLFLSIAYNYRGVCSFIDEDVTNAEKDWIKARRFAREAKSTFAEAKVLPNLADIAIMHGKFDLAKNYLDKARTIFEEVNDYDGLAVIEFNYTLYYIEAGDRDNALYHFKRCNEIAFPLPIESDRKMYREEVIKRARKRGMDDIEKLI
jgi:tetratricopeptide (TPR) repeat protein/DNA-binding MarR family transcriptional regulator